jgi:hypothetical protein
MLKNLLVQLSQDTLFYMLPWLNLIYATEVVAYETSIFREIKITVDLINWSNEWRKKSSCLICTVRTVHCNLYKRTFLYYKVRFSQLLCPGNKPRRGLCRQEPNHIKQSEFASRIFNEFWRNLGSIVRQYPSKLVGDILKIFSIVVHYKWICTSIVTRDNLHFCDKRLNHIEIYINKTMCVTQYRKADPQ